MIEEVINAEKKHHDEDAEKADDFTADFISETVSQSLKDGGRKYLSKPVSEAGENQQILNIPESRRNKLQSTFQVVGIVQEIPLDHQEAHVTELTEAQLLKIGDIAKLNNND